MRKSLHSVRYEAFCKSMQIARKAAGLSQQQLAKKLGEHQSFVSRYETGERRLDVIEYITIAEALDLDFATHLKEFGRKSNKTR